MSNYAPTYTKIIDETALAIVQTTHGTALPHNHPHLSRVRQLLITCLHAYDTIRDGPPTTIPFNPPPKSHNRTRKPYLPGQQHLFPPPPQISHPAPTSGDEPPTPHPAP